MSFLGLNLPSTHPRDDLPTVSGQKDWCRKPLTREEIAESMDALGVSLVSASTYQMDQRAHNLFRGAQTLRDSETIEQRRRPINYLRWWEREDDRNH